MRYVIVSVLEDDAGRFNNNLRKEVFNVFGAKSSKLPAHFTIKAPFEASDITHLEEVLSSFSKTNKSNPYKIHGYDHFDDRVIFMKVLMSEDGKNVHDSLVDKLSYIEYIDFKDYDGKDKVFHVTITSKKIRSIFSEIYDYVNNIPCEFDCQFDNICIYCWVDDTWILHKKYALE